VPEGRWSFHDFLDSDGGAEQRPFRVDLELSRYRRSRAPRRLALGRPGARAHQLHDQRRAAPHRLRPLPAVARCRSRRQRGLLRNLDEWIAREGSILKPRFPAPLGMRANTRFRVMSCIFGSLAQANGGAVPAGLARLRPLLLPLLGRGAPAPILCIEGLGVGTGGAAVRRRGGRHLLHRPGELSRRVCRAGLPLARGALCGAPGFRRTRPPSRGLRVVRDVRVLAEKAELATRMENTVVAPYGVAGGRAGRTGTHHPQSGHARGAGAGGAGRRHRAQARRSSSASRRAAAGGWGDPLERDPERVRTDVARGFITARGAFEDYGVLSIRPPSTWTRRPRTRSAAAGRGTCP
jgi:hypothetical protein